MVCDTKSGSYFFRRWLDMNSYYVHISLCLVNIWLVRKTFCFIMQPDYLRSNMITFSLKYKTANTYVYTHWKDRLQRVGVLFAKTNNLFFSFIYFSFSECYGVFLYYILQRIKIVNKLSLKKDGSIWMHWKVACSFSRWAFLFLFFFFSFLLY